MIYTLNPATWKWDFPALPASVRLAWLAHPPSACISRLTDTFYAFRPTAGSGVWSIGALPDLLPLIEALPIPISYAPPKSGSAESDPLDLSNLKIDLD